jgi:inhibitor of KinA sporulation pathway (predicted exonuclease)
MSMGHTFSTNKNQHHHQETQQFEPVYGDFEATTDDGGIYKHPPQRPDQLSDAVRNMCKLARRNPRVTLANDNMQEPIEGGFHYNGQTLDMFWTPRVNPQLYPFTTQLTTITQEMLNGQPTFKDSFPMLLSNLKSIGVDANDPKFLAVFCGDWDFKTLLSGAFLNDEIEPPVFFQRVCNIKVPFENALKDKPELANRHSTFLATQEPKDQRMSMKSMLHTINENIDGQHHRAHDDATNISKIGNWLQNNGYPLVPTYHMTVSKT